MTLWAWQHFGHNTTWARQHFGPDNTLGPMTLWARWHFRHNHPLGMTTLWAKHHLGPSTFWAWRHFGPDDTLGNAGVSNVLKLHVFVYWHNHARRTREREGTQMQFEILGSRAEQWQIHVSWRNQKGLNSPPPNKQSPGWCNPSTSFCHSLEISLCFEIRY